MHSLQLWFAAAAPSLLLVLVSFIASLPLLLNRRINSLSFYWWLLRLRILASCVEVPLPQLFSASYLKWLQIAYTGFMKDSNRWIIVLIYSASEILTSLRVRSALEAELRPLTWRGSLLVDALVSSIFNCGRTIFRILLFLSWVLKPSSYFQIQVSSTVLLCQPRMLQNEPFFLYLSEREVVPWIWSTG